MNAKRFSLTLVATCLCLSVAGQASAFYAAHIGRWATRDPVGEMGRFGMEIPSGAGTSMGFIARDNISPTMQYSDGANLYQFVRSNPSYYLDPSGLYSCKGEVTFHAGESNSGGVRMEYKCTITCNCPNGKSAKFVTDDGKFVADDWLRWYPDHQWDDPEEMVQDCKEMATNFPGDLPLIVFCEDDPDNCPKTPPTPMPIWMNEPGLKPSWSPFDIAAGFMGGWLTGIGVGVGTGAPPVILPIPKPAPPLPLPAAG